MALNPRVWYPIAAIGAVVNVVGVAFATRPAEPLHATVHAVLAVALGVWAQRLKTRQRSAVRDTDTEAEIADLQDEVEELRREQGELQERLDFAERLLSRERDMERLPERPKEKEQP